MTSDFIIYRWIYSSGFVTGANIADLSGSQDWLGFQDDFGNLVLMHPKYGEGRLQYINNGVPLTHPPAMRLAQDYGM